MVSHAIGEGPSHGYAIGKEVEARSGGRLSPTTGGLYQALKRLGDDGLIEQAPEAEARSPDSRRAAKSRSHPSIRPDRTDPSS